MIDIHRITGFDWDSGNARRNEKHCVSQAEAEQVFFNEPLVLAEDVGHSAREPRFHALGITDQGRSLHITFTLRFDNTRLRVISARICTVRSVPSMKKPFKPLPEFRNEQEEREFWETHDSSEYVDWAQAKKTSFPNLKPTTQSISLRLPLSLLEGIKSAANSKDVPYQSLIKIWLHEKLHEGHGH